MNWEIVGGRSLIDGTLSPESVFVSDGVFSHAAASERRVLHASNLLVLPGIVDIHGDGFERQMMPRPGVRFDTRLALKDTDRQLVANGITTAFHGLTISWEPGLRSIEAARHLVEALFALRPALGCDTRLHLRWETFALDELPDVVDWLKLSPPPILAFNDHTTGSVLKGTIARKIGQMAERSGLSREDYMALLERVWSRREEVGTAIARLAAMARANGNVLLAHDEASPKVRAEFRALGVLSSEFPLTIETAAAARAAGEHVVLGAPNVVRGGSHNGALDATDAIRRDLCTVLASDYHYPSPLHAAFRLVRDGVLDLAKAWALVSANPAEAAGLPSRGRIAEGLRADLILVDAEDMSHPEVVATMTRGRIVYSRRMLDRASPAPSAFDLADATG